MLLPDMIGQPEAAEVGEFPLLDHQLLYLFCRLTRGVPRSPGEVCQREAHLLAANELLHCVLGAAKGLSSTKHIASRLFKGFEEDLPGL